MVLDSSVTIAAITESSQNIDSHSLQGKSAIPYMSGASRTVSESKYYLLQSVLNEDTYFVVV
jgi:hypothetical protein